MDSIPVSSERKAQLEAYAHLRGSDPVAVLDHVLESYFDLEKQEYESTVADVLEAYGDAKAGRTFPMEEVMEEIRATHGFPR